jgi:hypothetical protein
MVVCLDIRAGHLVLPFPVRADRLINLAFHVRPEHRLQAVLLFLALVLKEASYLPVGLLVLPHLLAGLRKPTRAILLLPATDPFRLRLAPHLLLPAVVPYPWIPLSYPVHLRWSKSRCLAR